jgi:hypothetical protein
MTMGVIKIPGEFSEIEGAILEYLYDHHGKSNTTAKLVKALRPLQVLAEEITDAEPAVLKEQQEAFDEVQYGIETLIMAGLVSGDIEEHMGRTQHINLQITRKGQPKAIAEKRRLKEIIHSIPRPPKEG